MIKRKQNMPFFSLAAPHWLDDEYKSLYSDLNMPFGLNSMMYDLRFQIVFVLLSL